jgi:hypothetical protein
MKVRSVVIDEAMLRPGYLKFRGNGSKHRDLCEISTHLRPSNFTGDGWRLVMKTAT